MTASTTNTPRPRMRQAAVAIVVFAAAIVAAIAVPRPNPVPSPAPHASAPQLQPDAADATQTDCARDVVDAPAAASAVAPGPTAPAELRLAVAPGEPGRDDYVGTCTIRDDTGAVLAELTATAGGSPLAFAVPLATAHLRVEAKGYRRVELRVPSLQSGVFALGRVVIEPDAAVHVRVDNLPQSWTGAIAASLGNGAGSSAWTLAHAASGAVELQLQAPSSFALQLAVDVVEGSGLQLHHDLELPPLASGEVRTCVLDAAALPRRRVRVVGPPPPLLGHLTLQWRRSPPTPTGKPDREVMLDYIHSLESQHEVTLDAAGVAELRGFDLTDATFELRVDCAASPSPLQTRPAGADEDVLLEPGEPIVALAVLDTDGRTLPCSLEVGEYGSEARDLHPLLAATVHGAASVVAFHASTGTMRWPVQAIVWHGDVGELPVATAQRTATLRVVATGDAPPDRSGCTVELRRGAEVVRRGQETRRAPSRWVFDDLAPGDYSVHWLLRDHDGPLIAARVALAAGAPQELRAAWPSFVTWQGEVVDWLAVPPGDRLPTLRVVHGTSAAYDDCHRIDDTGRFTLVLPVGDPAPSVVALQLGRMGLPARIVAVDAGARRILVEHPPTRWVDVRVEPQFGDWQLTLQAEDGAVWSVLDQPARVLLPASGPLHGVLYEGILLDRRVTSCLVVDGSRATVVVAPTGGHWLDLRVESHAVQVCVELIDALNHALPIFEGSDPADERLWIPDTARAVRVRCQPGGVETLSRDSAEFVVK